MSSSLRDQLLKVGLIDEKRIKQARQETSRKNRQQQGKREVAKPETSAADLARRQEAERARQLNLKQKEAAERKARAAEIRQLILSHRVDRSKAELAHQFQHGNYIRRILIHPPQKEQLLNGRLAIASLGQAYELVPREVGERIAQRDADRVVFLDRPEPEKPRDESDPYAGYEVPDDLMW